MNSTGCSHSNFLKTKNEENTIKGIRLTRNMHSVLLPAISLLSFKGGNLSRSQFLLDDERFTRNTVVNILHVIGSGFKMTSRIITLGDVTMIFCAVFNRDIEISYRGELI